jgi:Flp pilus assembly pilin Flp
LPLGCWFDFGDIAGLKPSRLSCPVVILTDQRGQAMVEYAFTLVLVALVVLTMLVVMGTRVVNLYSNITATLHSAGL